MEILEAGESNILMNIVVAKRTVSSVAKANATLKAAMPDHWFGNELTNAASASVRLS